MNRRDFLQGLGAMTATVALPALAARPDMTLAYLDRVLAAVDNLGVIGEHSDYFAFIHPSTWRSVKEYELRWRWLEAWRSYRVARRRDGLSELSARDVWRLYQPPNRIKDAEVGRWEGVRVIQSEHVIGTGIYKIRLT